MSTSVPPTRTAAARRADRVPAVRRTLFVILGLNAIVVGIKLVVGVRTGALSVLGAALESGLDVFNNIVGITLVRVAARAPDEEHPYGHEKFETLGALAIVGFLSISCFEILRQAVERILGQRPPRVPSVGEVAIVAATMAVNVFVLFFERRRARAAGSSYLLADAAHTGSDLYVTAAAVGSLLLTRIGLGPADPVLAIAVALAIAWNGYGIVRATIPVLVDERGLEASEVRRVLEAIPAVVDVRAVRSRATASGLVLAEVTIGVDAAITVEQAHEVADSVEAHLADALGAAEVLVHVEPA